MQVGIIGAGIGGLATAVRLAVRGHQVEVFEANSYPGGKLTAFDQGSYRFDAGPSLFTMPEYVDELFELAGKNPQDYFQYNKLDIICNYFWEDGTRMSAFADEMQFAKEVEEKLGVSPNRILQSLRDSERKYQLTGEIFLHNSLHKAKTWLNRNVAKALLQLPRYDLFTTLNKVNERNLEHPKLVQFFNRFATYNGSNPYKTPGLMSIIPYFEHKIGAFYPDGGMHRITQAIFNLAATLGLKFHFNQLVQRINVENRKANALILAGGKKRNFDLLVSNMDIFPTYKKLLPNQYHPEKTLQQPRSTSALIFYWGIQHSFPELDLHNIFFSEDYKLEFDHLDAGTLSEDPTVYVNISQKQTSDDAPPGCENWFTMINVPYNDGQDWDTIIPRARKDILNKLSRILGRDIRPLIQNESILDPRSIEQRTSSHQGALYGTSSNNRMAAFLRHPNFSNRIKNLYFCGGSVHPGGGIPLCLLSAKIVDQLIHES